MGATNAAGRGGRPARPAHAQAEAQRVARDWLLKVVEESGLTLSRIAAGADLAPSTLYRVANDPNHPHVLSTVTIAKISRFTGIAPPAGFETSDEPAPRGLAEAEAEPWRPGPEEGPDTEAAMRALAGDGASIDAWVLRTRALELAGCLPGDIVLLDLAAAPRPRDVVCAQVYDFERMRAETVWRIYDPPFLVAATTDPALARPILESQAPIKGVVVGLWRPRRG